MPKTKPATITLRVGQKMRKAIEKRAAEREMSVSEYIRACIYIDLEA